MRTDVDRITSMLVWQMAQILGYKDRDEIVDHAILMVVDFDTDRCVPVFVGARFETPIIDSDKQSWSSIRKLIVSNFISPQHRDSVSNFYSDEAARQRFEAGNVFDSEKYTSLDSHGIPRWTLTIQHLFMSTASAQALADGLSALDAQPPESHTLVPDDANTSRKPHLMSYFLTIEIDEADKNMEALQYLAQHDQLTGLFNRHMISVLVNDGPSVVIAIDINLFKEVNDEYGHAAGDAALCALSAMLQIIFDHEGEDLIFRVGGDEFLVVMKGASEERARTCMEALAADIILPVELDDPQTGSAPEEPTFSVSIGYAICDGDFVSALERADEALYYTKEHGRRGYNRG